MGYLKLQRGQEENVIRESNDHRTSMRAIESKNIHLLYPRIYSRQFHSVSSPADEDDHEGDGGYTGSAPSVSYKYLGKAIFLQLGR